jgi:protein-S-isoprenylcysteine O-methyltransferase Ste14
MFERNEGEGAGLRPMAGRGPTHLEKRQVDENDRAERLAMKGAIPPPNRIPWPPILFGSGVAASVLLGAALPGPDWLHGLGWSALGWAFMLAGVGLDIAAMTTMSRQRANILPHRSATALVTTGPFAWSRNPIYLGNTIALSGAAFAFGNPWFLAAALVVAIAVTQLAVKREEAHLAQLFGAEWRAYTQRTARWFGR